MEEKKNLFKCNILLALHVYSSAYFISEDHAVETVEIKRI